MKDISPIVAAILTDLTNLLAECERAIELGAEASTGPWKPWPHTHFVTTLDLDFLAPFTDQVGEIICETRINSRASQNRDAIAHARAHSPRASRALLQSVEALKKALEALKQYSDPNNWTMDSFTDGNSSNFDGWTPARVAIAAIAASCAAIK